MRLWLGLALSFSVVACGGSPFVGTWTGTNLTVSDPLIKGADAEVTFTATNITAAITLKDGSNQKIAAVTAGGTYTSTDKQITVTITSVSGTDNGGTALATSTKDGAQCASLVGQEVCVPNQTSDYTISGDVLTTSLKSSGGTVFTLKVKKKA